MLCQLEQSCTQECLLPPHLLLSLQLSRRQRSVVLLFLLGLGAGFTCAGQAGAAGLRSKQSTQRHMLALVQESPQAAYLLAITTDGSRMLVPVQHAGAMSKSAVNCSAGARPLA